MVIDRKAGKDLEGEYHDLLNFWNYHVKTREKYLVRRAEMII
jgi:hypothetical protein